MLTSTRLRTSAAAVALAALIGGAPAAAQEPPAEFQSWRLPGWAFTPGIIVGALFDDNVSISFPQSGPGGATPSDTLFRYQPFGQLDFYSARTMFSSGYQGAVRRYVDFRELNGIDQHGYVTLRHLVTRRVTVFVNDNYASVPTTDELQLNGLPFRRTGARYNAFAGGVEARLTRSLDFATRYDLTWVDFVNKDVLLNGGFVNGIRSTVSHRIDQRSSVGGEYGIRWADLNGGTKNLLFQETGAVYRYRTGPLTTFEAAAGFAHLDDRTRGITRNGPYARVGLTHNARRASLGVDYERSFVPSLSFGGTNQSQELRGYVRMPLNRNRLYLQEGAAWRRTDPFVAEALALDSIWLSTTGGYALTPWFRLEIYHSYTRQDTKLAAGQISRNVFGVQFVVSEPVRIR